MDLSKLPKLSQTPTPADAQMSSADPPSHDRASPPTPAPMIDHRSVERASAGIGAEVWISLVVGILLLLIGRNFAVYVSDTLAGRTFHTHVTWQAGPQIGQEVAYWDLSGGTSWTEAGLFVFGLALVIEAIMLMAVFSRFPHKAPLAWAALAVTTLATVLNLYVSVLVLSKGLIPLMSGLAVAFGGYMAAYQWRLARSLWANGN